MGTEKSPHDIFMRCISNIFHESDNCIFEYTSGRRSAASKVSSLLRECCILVQHTIGIDCGSTTVDATRRASQHPLLVVAYFVATSIRNGELRPKESHDRKYLHQYNIFVDETDQPTQPFFAAGQLSCHVGALLHNLRICFRESGQYKTLISRSPDFSTSKLSCSAPCINASSFKSGGKLNRNGF